MWRILLLYGVRFWTEYHPVFVHRNYCPTDLNFAERNWILSVVIFKNKKCLAIDYFFSSIKSRRREKKREGVLKKTFEKVWRRITGKKNENILRFSQKNWKKKNLQKRPDCCWNFWYFIFIKLILSKNVYFYKTITILCDITTKKRTLPFKNTIQSKKKK